MISEPRLLYAVAVLAFVADRLLKWSVMHIGVGWGPVSFSLYENAGLMFSIPVPYANLLVGISVVVYCGLIGGLAALTYRGSRFTPPLFLITLGATSNLYDRLAHGAIIDFLIFFGRSAINLADVMIVVGLVLIILQSDVLQAKRKRG